MVLVTVAWMFGSIYFSSTSGTPFTRFAEALRASPFQYGLLSAMPFIAALLSLPGSLYTDKTGQRKRIFLITHIAHRLLWIPIGFVPLWIYTNSGGGAGSAAISVFLLLVFMNYCGQALGGPAWFGWMADIVPGRLRGRYFSIRRSIGLLTAIPAALVVGWVLDRLNTGAGGADPVQMLRWCGYIFMAAAVFGVIDILLFLPVPNIKAVPHNRPLREIFARPMRNKPFLWFAGFAATLTFAVSFMGQFVTLYLIRELKINNLQIQLMLLVLPMVAQMVVLPAWGRATDIFGKKPVLIVSSLGFVPIGFGWCFMHAGGAWLGYALTVLGAALYAGVEVANFNVVLEFAGTDEQEGTSSTTYFALANVFNNVAGAMGGLASGAIGEWLQHWTWNSGLPGLAQVGYFEVLFALSGVLRLAAVLVFLPRLHEPDSKPAAQVVRFMTANVYNNIFNAISLPLRMVKRRDEEEDDDTVEMVKPKRQSEAKEEE